MYDLIFADSMT